MKQANIIQNTVIQTLDVFGEAVLSSSKFRTLLASTRGEITNSLSDNSKQVASIEKVITMILGQ